MRLVTPGQYAVITTIETEIVDAATGTVTDNLTDTYSGAACLISDVQRRIAPTTFADSRCQVSNVRADAFGEAFDMVCLFEDEGLVRGGGSLAVDRSTPTGFREEFRLKSPAGTLNQQVTIVGVHMGECPPPQPLAGQ